MNTSVRRPASIPRTRTTALALAAALTLSLASVAGAAEWTSPKRIFTAGGAPVQSMARDGSGAVHIATHRGSSGVWYLTNAPGTWQECQVTSHNDLQPSIAVSGSSVHIAFARFETVGRGIYTASGSGCGDWTVIKRFSGGARQPSLGAYGSMLSLAFKTDTKKLKFRKGPAHSATWTTKQTVDTICCTSAPSLALTHTGAPRIAYGDGTSRSNGLKYAVKAGSGWKKVKVANGRIKQVALALDRTPGLFSKPPTNAPYIAYTVKKKGTYRSNKPTSYVSGRWTHRYFGKAFGPVDVTQNSNLNQVVYTKSGKLYHVRHSGGIKFTSQLTSSGSDTYPQLDGGALTFSRGKGTTGVYYSRQK